MKKIFIYPFLFISLIIQAQEETKTTSTINDFNFGSTTSTAFILLDQTPTAIHTPKNLRSLAVYLSNGFKNTNIALEINPYWVFKNKDNTYEDFRGIKDDKINPFKGFKTNSSFSFAYTEKKYEGFKEEKNVMALGFNLNILNIYGKKRTEKLVEVLDAFSKGSQDEVSKRFENYIQHTTNQDLNNEKCKKKEYKEYEKLAKKYKKYEKSQDLTFYNDNLTNLSDESLAKKYIDGFCEIHDSYYNNQKNIKPILRIDGSFGYSLLFKENEISSSTANRFGAWLTLDAALTKNIHIFAIGKYVDDEFNQDKNQVYFTTNFWDYGGKVSLDIDKFNFSYEYLKRSGDGDKFRSVGNVSYQINKKMSINGGFGKDFKKENNLITILGINWGLDLGEKSLSLKKN